MTSVCVMGHPNQVDQDLPSLAHLGVSVDPAHRNLKKLIKSKLLYLYNVHTHILPFYPQQFWVDKGPGPRDYIIITSSYHYLMTTAFQ